MANAKNLALVLNDAELDLMEAASSIVERYGLPCYLMEFLVDKLHRRIIDGKAAEIAAAKRELEDKECK